MLQTLNKNIHSRDGKCSKNYFYLSTTKMYALSMVVKLKKYGNLLSLVIYYRNKVIKKNIFYWISLSSFIILHSLSLSALSLPFSSIFFLLARVVQALIATEESILHKSNHTIGDTCWQCKVWWSAPSHHFDHRPVWWAVTTLEFHQQHCTTNLPNPP